MTIRNSESTGSMTCVQLKFEPWAFGIGVSSDDRSILYTEREMAESSIMLVKNFR
jgi:hypothetical protein